MLRAEMTCETPDYWTEHFQKHGVENPPAFYEQLGPGMGKIASLNAHIWLDLPRDFEKQYPTFNGEVPALISRLPPVERDEDGYIPYAELERISVERSMLHLNCYGVVDTPEQFRALFGDFLDQDPRNFFVTFTEIRKDEEPEKDGWRWEKWGPYYGTQKSRADYIYDEPEIERIFLYHVYEL